LGRSALQQSLYLRAKRDCSESVSDLEEFASLFARVAFDIVGLQKGGIMTYVMAKPCLVCEHHLTKKAPTDSAECGCGKHVREE
jgi:hypothetical protein